MREPYGQQGSRATSHANHRIHRDGRTISHRADQAGYCYANNDPATCNSIYGDVVNGSSDESTGGGTFNFSVRSCGQPLSAMGSWPSAVQMSSATGTNNSNQECSAGVYWKSDAYGDTTGYTQLYWAKYDDCYEIGANVSVTG